MAVEAGHHTLFHPQMIDNQSSIDRPLSGMYCTGTGFTDSMNVFPSNAESGLTCSVPVSRNRAPDPSDINAFVNSQNMNHNPIGRSETYTFLGENISLQIQQQQFEIDQFIAHHTEKVRVDIEERRKRNSRRIIAIVEEGLSKRLRAKEEEMMKIAKLNWALEEKVKSLCVENQIWRELAQTNEATANALRGNLKQVLEQVHTSVEEDAQSCCESNNEENDDCSSSNKRNRLCKKCWQDESCVLLLPCRHLCLCTRCASSINICPVCKSTKNISVHVNMS